MSKTLFIWASIVLISCIMPSFSLIKLCCCSLVVCTSFCSSSDFLSISPTCFSISPILSNLFFSLKSCILFVIKSRSFLLEEISSCIFSLSVSSSLILFSISEMLFFNSSFLLLILFNSYFIASILEFFLVISIFNSSTSLFSLTCSTSPFCSISFVICSIWILFS